MAMQRYTDEPGSPAWHARRARCFNAGDASAMLGCHPSGKTRTQLQHELHTGLEREFSDYVQEKVINPGHRIEALWRPIAEEILGEDLQVMAGTLDVGLSRPLGASLDGVSFMEDTLGECKSANEALRVALPHTGRDSHERNDARELPKGYRVQLEQQQLVTGAARTLFSACQFNEAGEVTEERHAFYTSDPVLRAEILAGWKRLDADRATYVPTEIKERPAAEVKIALPALVIHAKGEITTSNMKEYGVALAARLAEVRAIQLITDQDFSNAKESAKLLRENIQQAKLAKDAMLAQTVTVGEAARMIDTWCEDMRLTALKLEQDVEREDKAKKAAMIAKAKGDYERHIEALKIDTGGPWIVLPAPNFPEAIKSKRSFSSMQDALDTMLANAKIKADDSARGIRAALACMAEEGKGYEFLLSDRLAHIHKPVDDVRTLVRARITEHKAAEDRRAAELAERERARIRAEEEAKARATAAREQQEREAAERRQREEQEALAHRQEQEAAALERRQREDEVARAEQERRRTEVNAAGAAAMDAIGAAKESGDFPAAVINDLEQAASGLITDLTLSRVADASKPAAGPAVIPMPTRAPAVPVGPPTLRLGQMNERLGFTVTADFLASLGFPATADRNARLYHEHSWHAICTAIAQHVVAVANGQKAAA